MKKLILIISFLVSTSIVHTQDKEFSKLTGPYLGQKSPGMTLEAFAPGIVSSPEFIDFKGAFSPDVKEYYYSHELAVTIPDLLFTEVKKQIPAISYSQENMPGWSKEDPISIGVRVTIRSSVLSQDREILISLPEEYAVSEERYPVIYFTDGSTERLSLFRGVVDLLAEANKIPNMILVGIVQLNRNDELTPIDIQEPNPEDPGKSYQQTGNGAPLFRFMEKELIPIIESKYRTLNSRIYIGHSRGGMFGIYCMQTDPKMFNAQIDVDPSLWWKDGLIVKCLESYLNKNPNFDNSLVISVTREMRRENGEYFDQLNDLMERKSNPYFKYHFMEMESTESHLSSILPTLHQGLLKVFEGHSVPDDANSTLTDFLLHFSKPILGVTYGLKESMINEFAHNKLRLKQIDEAIAAYQESILRFRNSANAFAGLGDAYFQAGRLEESLESMNKAVELARLNHDKNIQTLISNRDIVKKMLNKK